VVLEVEVADDKVLLEVVRRPKVVLEVDLLV
jgi:hypothetical protein